MKRRYKLVIIIFISFIMIEILYLFLHQESFLYVSINDYDDSIKYTNYSYDSFINDCLKNNKKYRYYSVNKNHLTVNKLLESIQNNDKNIMFYLNKANMITLNMGTYELNNYIDLNEKIYLNYINDYIKVLEILQKNSSAYIFVINMYGSKYEKLDNILKEYTSKNHINYINLSNINNEYIVVNNQNYLNYRGSKIVSQQIISKINNNEKYCHAPKM